MAAMWAEMLLCELVGHKWVAKRISVSWHNGNVAMLIIWQNLVYVLKYDVYLFLVVGASEFWRRIFACIWRFSMLGVDMVVLSSGFLWDVYRRVAWRLGICPSENEREHLRLC